MLFRSVNLVNYGEIFKLDPMTSVASYQVGDTTSEVTKRAEDALEHSHTSGNKPEN